MRHVYDNGSEICFVYNFLSTLGKQVSSHSLFLIFGDLPGKYVLGVGDVHLKNKHWWGVGGGGSTPGK